MAYIATTNNKKITNDQAESEFVTAVRGKFSELKSEIAERNGNISLRDGYIYGDYLERSYDIPIGHDATSVNWLRRTVEIHKNMFMSRGFQVISTYDAKDLNTVDNEEDRKRLEIENRKEKEFAEQRMNLVEAIQRDNGGAALWSTLAENASAIGDSAVKIYYNEEDKKIDICQIESIDNLYVLWNKDDFRKYDAVGYVYQVSKQVAVADYGAPEDTATSPMGSPFTQFGDKSPAVGQSGQPMVTIMEVTGIIDGWKIENGQYKKVRIGEEEPFNCLIVGNQVTRVVTEKRKLPKYYIFPNKRQRRRPWGISDISDAAVQINQAYVETLSDWRELARKVNFPKYKAYGFGEVTQMPKSEPRAVQFLPLSEGQDIQEIAQGDDKALDWGRQLDELKEQYVRETGISRVLFDDPSVTFNSNQALLTSMKPTSDIAEAKKQLWAPVIVELFSDALEMLAEYDNDIKELVDPESNWNLKVMWPSVMQKEDPMYQSMLLNRFNAGTISLQTYLEAQGETKEEIDRMKDEMTDPITAAVLGKQLPLVAQTIVNAATAELQSWYQMMLPQQQPAESQTAGVNPNGGVSAPGSMLTPASNASLPQPVSQPGTGATTATPAGALTQANQNAGV